MTPSLQDAIGSMRRRTPLLLLFAALIALGLFTAREPILRGIGQLLLTSEASANLTGKVDVIVITLDAEGAGILEAADLISAGVSNRVAVFNDPLSAAEKEFVRRGLPREDFGTRASRQLHALGVLDVEVISRAVDGSHQAVLELPAWLGENAYRSAVVITSADHSRRLDRMLRRALRGHDAVVSVRVATYSSFNPEKWWKTREGLRRGIVEVQKLLLDVIQHPLQFSVAPASHHRRVRPVARQPQSILFV
jgi:uncharacterized SAM-binding protein YcdF (DUF218 family)